MRPSILVAGALCCLLCGVFCEAGQAQSLSRIAAPVNQFEQTPLTGNTPAQLLKATDQGLVQPNLTIPRMMLMLRPSAQQQAALDQLLIEQQDRTSPNYHRWLSPEEYAARFGVAQADAQALTSWLQQQGFTQIQLSHTGRFISFSGTAGVAQNAFATELHHVLLDGRIHTTNVTSPLVPTAFADLIGAIIGLDDLPSRSFAKPAIAAMGMNTPAQGSYFTPAAFAGAYDLGPLQASNITGAGVTIVVVGQADPNFSDLHTFQQMFGLPQTSPQMILTGSPDPGTTSSADVQEAALDLEWVSAVAPGATVVFDYAVNAVTQALVDAIDNKRGQIVSASYGDCESSGIAVNGMPKSIQSIIQMGNAMGITVLAASGDQGPAACEDVTSTSAKTGLAVNFPASVPEVTAVGGTGFIYSFNSTSSYIAEEAWNDTVQNGPLAASGGGVSTLFAEPSWQQGVPGVPSGSFRFVPDVALNASRTVEPYEVVSGGIPIPLGGTSAATPAWAGILALVQQYLSQTGIQPAPGLGNVNPMLYELSQISSFPVAGTTIFHDITIGSNVVPCTSGPNCSIGFSAGSGYDEVTGLGSVDGDQLAVWWGYMEGKPVLSASPASAAFGNQMSAASSDPISFTISNNGNGLLSISSVTFTGMNPASFSETDNCGTPRQIFPSGSCTISVTFTPTTVGAQSAALVISSNDSLSPMAIGLTGTGTTLVQSGTFAGPLSSPTPNGFTTATGYGGGPIIQAADGNYYGVNSFGGSNTAQGVCPGVGTAGGGCGTVFRITPSGYNVLYSFQGGTDGEFPSSLIQGPDGNLYVTALQGGLITTQCPSGCGTLSKITLSGTFSSIYNFGQTRTDGKIDGQNPSTLTLGADGSIYGTTLVGGANASGTIFVLTPGSNTPSILYSLQGGAAGSFPETLVQGSNGLFYGMTQESQAGDYGTVFQIDAFGNYQNLYTFKNQTDSANVESPGSGVHVSPNIVITQPSRPHGGGATAPVYATPKALVQYSDGNFYGTTASPLAVKRTVFQITPAGVLNTIYTFTSAYTYSGDGGGSLYGLTLGSDGNFYGMSGDLIFKVTSGGSFFSLYHLPEDASGDPQPGYLLYASDGTFVDSTTGYGQTQIVGSSPAEYYCSSNCGYAFDYAPSPALSAPVQVSLSSTTVPVNTPVVLNWQALQAYSLTSQQCYAYLSGGSGGGTWAGKQNGVFAGGVYSGVATITPAAGGTYTYALTCGGTLSASASLTVTQGAPTVALSASPSSLALNAPLTLTATVSNPSGKAPVPTGTVVFTTGTKNIGSANLVNGVASVTTVANGQSLLPPITSVGFNANYAGDTYFSSATASTTVLISTLTVATTALPNGAVSNAYSATLTASGGKSPYMWSITSGTLPTGLSLNATTGVISGTPTQAASYTFVAQVKDSTGAIASSASNTTPLQIMIGASLSVTFVPSTNALVGTPYSGSFQVVGGVAPYTFQITAGSLPPGLVLSGSTGNITGTPTAVVTSSFTIKITDSEKTPMTVSKSISISIAPPTLLLTTTSLPGGTIAKPYSATLLATGGVLPYMWTLSAGTLPTGLSISSMTGVISGTPSQVGTSNFTIQVKDSSGTPLIATAPLSIKIFAALTPTTSSVPPAVAGSAYTATLAATGGVAPYTWKVSSGALPAGMSLAQGTGVLSGTPTQSGAFSFTAQVSDSESVPQSSSVGLMLNVTAPLAITTSSLPLAPVGVPYRITLAASGGTPGYRWSVAPGSLPAGLTLGSTSGVISGTPPQVGSYTFAVQLTDSEGTPVSVSAFFTIVVYGGTATPPIFSLVSGSYGLPQTIAISDATAGSTIYYTTNGTAPTTSSAVYSGPITVSASETVQAIAFAPGYAPSAVANAVYQIGSGIIVTIAGTGYPGTENGGATGDGGPAVHAGLSDSILGVVVDNSGNYYIADSDGNRVRKVTPTGIISTVAGTGVQGYSGDGGPATSAQLYGPSAVALDNKGNLYISDANNACIRKVDSAGIISTIAGNGVPGFSGDGGPAANAELLDVLGLAFDNSSGNLYISDTSNGRIRMVTPAGVISTVAGNGNFLTGSIGDGGAATDATLSEPGGIALDGAGNLYIADFYNSRVRKVTPAGVISTVAGNGTSGFSGDGGPATAAEFSDPAAVAVDSGGNLYIADFGNARIREVSSAGLVSTVAGTGVLGTTGDGGLATSAELIFPNNVTVDSHGTVYISDSGYIVRAIGATATTPIFSPVPSEYTSTQTVTITDNTPGATIYYTTDGTIPTTGSKVYTGPISVSSNELVEAIAVVSGYTNSATAIADYVVMPVVATPVFSPPPGTYNDAVTVTLSDATPGAFIYYTTDGSTPSSAGSDDVSIFIGSGSLTVTSSETIKALAVEGGYANSSAVGSYVITSIAAATPAISNSHGPYTASQTVTITDATAGSTIYYTTDGTTPSKSSTVYTGPFTVNAVYNLIGVQAVAYAPGHSQSAVALNYVVPASLHFVPITPCRVADTRNANGAFGGPILQAGVSREFDVPQSACNIPPTAAAYSLNITVVPPGGLGFLAAYPSGQPLPFASTLNSNDGRTKANAAIVAAGSNGGVSLYVSSPTHAIIDINGYFVLEANSTDGLEFYPITPCRIADTRNATGPLGGPSIAGNTSRAFPVLSSACQVPSTAQAYSLNVTAVPNGPLSFLTTWPTGQAQPLTSTLNAQPSNVTANAAIVAAGTNGEISVYVTNTADVVLDINGYFAPPGNGGLSLYTVPPCRIIDTRTAAGAFAGTLPVNVETSACALPSTAEAYVLSTTVVPAVSLGFISLWPSGQPQPLVSTLNANDSAITSNMALVPVSNGVINVYASNSTNVILDISSFFGP